MGIADDYKEMTGIVAKMDERRQVQLASQLAAINRLMAWIMRVRQIVMRPLPPVGDWKDRHDEILEMARFGTHTDDRILVHTEDGRMWTLDTVEVHGKDVIVNVLPLSENTKEEE